MTNPTSDEGRLLEEFFFRGRHLSPDRQKQLVGDLDAVNPALGEQLRGLYRCPPGEHELGDMPAEPADPIDLATDTEFGNCLIVKEIGAGGMGAVYLALDLENSRRPSALKVLQSAMLGDADRVRFRQETEALALLEHPNIARLYRQGVQQWKDAARPYFVMEYIDGKSLDRHADAHDLSVDERLEILEKICLAVNYGHLRNVFHRDLKPANILVTASHEPKIIDYGISHLASPTEESAGDGRKHERSGTIVYMAPETAAGATGSPDARTDVYSLGVIAFELFARRRPAVVLGTGKTVPLDSGVADPLKMKLIAGCEREFLGDADPRFAGDLEIVIAKALSREMSDRYSDAGELASEFRRIRDRLPIRARPRSTVYETRLFVARNRGLVAASVLIFLLAVIAAVGFGVGEMRARRAYAKELAARREVERQIIAAHFRSADIAEQRGNWAGAVDEYCAIRLDPAQDNLPLNIRELRALGRLNRFAEATALIDRIERDYPHADQSRQFAFVKGFILWTSDPAKSTALITNALAVNPTSVDSDRLSLADRAFARGLITPDIHVAAASFREAVGYDSFNHDAWSLLSLCDLALGDAQRCEQDAVVLRHFFPDSGVGGVLASVAAAFQGRRDLSHTYLDSCTDLPTLAKASIAQTMDFISGIRSIDELREPTPWQSMTLVTGLSACAQTLTGSYSLPAPVTFKSILGYLSKFDVFNPDANAVWNTAAQWPNGNGEFATGWLAFKKQDWANASLHLKKSTTMPCLIDCRRVAAMTALLADCMYLQTHNISGPPGTELVRPDIRRILDSGGVVPDRFPEEWSIVRVALTCQFFSEARQMALAVRARIPDNPTAMYFQACADTRLGETAEACMLFNRAKEIGLADPMLKDADRQVAALLAAPATRPSGSTSAR